MDPNVVIELENDVRELASRIAFVPKGFKELLLSRRKTVEKSLPRESVLGIDGSYNSATLMGTEKVYAISAVSVRGDYTAERRLAGLFVFNDLPRSDLVARLIMSIFETLLAIDGILKSYKYIFTDGTPRSVFSMLTGQIAGIPSNLAVKVAQILYEVGLPKLYEELFYEDEEFGLHPKKSFYKILKEFSQEASKRLYENIKISKRFGVKIDVEGFKKAIREGEALSVFSSIFLSKASEVLREPIESLRILDEAIGRHRYELEPLLNSLALYSLYLRILEKLIEKLRESESVLIGVSKRVVREALEIEEIDFIEAKNKKLLGRLISVSPEFDSPGYLRLRVKELSRFSIEKAATSVSKVKKIERLLTLKDELSGGALLVKPGLSVLRVEYYHSPGIEVSDDQIASVVSALVIASRGLSGGVATIDYIEAAHKRCSIKNEYVSSLSRKLYRRIREMIEEEL